MFETLSIVHYPAPGLKKPSKPVERFDKTLAALAARMFELMRQHRGVGLAAPQVGKNIRLFVINPTGQPADDRVYVNPVLHDLDGEEESEEGCLSIPGINVKVTRAKSARITAFGLDGEPFEQSEIGYIPRIWQHEFDHLNGTLILDRMGPTAKLVSRKTLRELEDKYKQKARG